jgi:hypothetical protein
MWALAEQHAQHAKRPGPWTYPMENICLSVLHPAAARPRCSLPPAPQATQRGSKSTCSITNYPTHHPRHQLAHCTASPITRYTTMTHYTNISACLQPRSPVVGLLEQQGLHAELGHVLSWDGAVLGALADQLVIHVQHQLALPALQSGCIA